MRGERREGRVLSCIQDDAVAHVEHSVDVGVAGECLVVGDDDKCLVELVAQVEEKLVQLLLVLRVERPRGLIGEDNLGVVDERPRHGSPLPLATAELCGFVLETLTEAQVVEQFACAVIGVGPLVSANERWYRHVLERGELRQQLVELEHEANVAVAEVRQFALLESQHVDIVVEHLAPLWRIEGANDLQQRGLACAARPHDGDNLAIVDGDRDVAQDLQVAIAFCYVSSLNHMVER